MRYVLLDRITSLNPPDHATGVKCISLSDDVFVDHFPGRPVMPGALMIEGLAQLGGVLIEQTIHEKGHHGFHAVLTMIDRCKFRRLAVPGDRLEYSANAQTVTEDGGRVQVHATCEGERVCEATLTFAFAHVTNVKLLKKRAEYLEIWLHGTTENLDDDTAGDSGATA